MKKGKRGAAERTIRRVGRRGGGNGAKQCAKGRNSGSGDCFFRIHGRSQAQTWTTTWETVVDGQEETPNISITGLVCHPTNPQIIYASTQGSGVFKTTTGGKVPPGTTDPA